MPVTSKKKTTSSRWLWWGRNQEESSQNNDRNLAENQPVTSSDNSSQNSPQKLGENPKSCDKTDGSGNAGKGADVVVNIEPETEVKRSGSASTHEGGGGSKPAMVMHRAKSASDFEALTAPQKKYAKSLKLSSEEIVSFTPNSPSLPPPSSHNLQLFL